MVISIENFMKNSIRSEVINVRNLIMDWYTQHQKIFKSMHFPPTPSSIIIITDISVGNSVRNPIVKQLLKEYEYCFFN